MNVCDFGTVLKQLRTLHNLTQTELGKEVGISKAVISKYENGIGYPSYDVLIELAGFFGVSTDYLLGVSNGKTLDVSSLTDSQINAIYKIVSEFKQVNK